MEEYLKYREWIKYIAFCTYKKELEMLKNEETTFIFNNAISYEDKDNNILLVLNFDNYDDSIKRLYEYQTRLSQKYSICAISILNLNGEESNEMQFFAILFCVPLNRFEQEKEKYEQIFADKIKESNSIQEQIEQAIKEEKQLLLRFNQIPRKEIKQQINNSYCNILKEVTKTKRNINKNLEKVKKEFEKKQKQKVEFHIREIPDEALFSNNDPFLISLNEAKQKRKTVKLKKHNVKVKYQKNNLRSLFIQKDFSFIAIINLQEEKNIEKAIDMLKNVNQRVQILVIVNTKKQFDNVITVEKESSAIIATKGFYTIWITDKNYEQKNNGIYIHLDDLGKMKKEDFKREMLKKNDSLKALSNLENKNSIKVFTGTFLNFEGTNYYSGGAERYLIDLHEVCKQLGMKLRIYQKANYEFLRYYGDIEVVGLSNNNKIYEYQEESNDVILQKYHDISKDTSKLNIYSSFMECRGNALSPSIGISHGVAWDHVQTKYYKGAAFDKEWIVDSAISCDKMVTVDTNTANYFQTVDYSLGNNMEYVPNYVDTNEFAPIEKADNHRIRIVYPRRLYQPRGMYLLLEITDDLLNKYQNIEIHFVGKGFKEDTDKIQEKVNKWGNRVQMYHRSPNEMHKVYKDADISLIPTLYSEGTSLSCLEAMATGNAVIATRIGGLTDLIIHNYSGKLIEPNSEALYDAITDYLEHPETMEKCKKNAREVAKTFNKKRWQEKWKSLIQDYGMKKTNTKIVDYKLIKVYVKQEFLEDLELKKWIYDQLIEDKIIYIITPHNPRKTYSYGRLQYVEANTELYRKADEVYVYKEYDEKIEETNIKQI